MRALAKAFAYLRMRAARSGGVLGLIRLVWRNFRNMGWPYVRGAIVRALFELWQQAGRRGHAPPMAYMEWRKGGHAVKAPRWSDEDGHPTLISVVMPVYRPDLEHFKAAVASIQAQDYPHWELCMADDASGDLALLDLLDQLSASDARIKICLRAENGHISACSNSALELASGDYVLLFDQDDLLPPHALGAVAKAIALHPDAAIIYSDEDKVDESGSLHFDPYFKPDFDPYLFLGQNLVSHLGVYRRDLVSAIGGFRMGLEGSQDHDLALRVLELAGPQQVIHLPEVLYHWRASQGSTALANTEKSYASVAARRAVQEHLQRRAVAASVEPVPAIPFFNRVVYVRPDRTQRLVFVFLLPDETDNRTVERTLRQVLADTQGFEWEAEVLITRSARSDTRTLTRRLGPDAGPGHIRFLDVEDDLAAKRHLARLVDAQAELVCVVTEPMALCPAGWLAELAALALQPGVSAVAPRLLGPLGVQCHGGMVFPDAHHARHAFRGMPAGANPLCRSSALSQRFMALSPALVLCSARTWAHFVAESPLDARWSVLAMLLQAHRSGLFNCWTPFVTLRVGRQVARETDNLVDQLDNTQRGHWQHLCQPLLPDPGYNPNLSRRGDFQLAERGN